MPKEVIYLCIPDGYHVESCTAQTVLCVKKSIYLSKESPCGWYDTTNYGLPSLKSVSLLPLPIPVSSLINNPTTHATFTSTSTTWPSLAPGQQLTSSSFLSARSLKWSIWGLLQTSLVEQSLGISLLKPSPWIRQGTLEIYSNVTTWATESPALLLLNPEHTLTRRQKKSLLNFQLLERIINGQ